MAATASTNTVKELFNSMEYGPAPESPDVAKAWIADHGEKFGLFINNKWVHPENRKTYSSKNPCTGEVLAVTTQGEQADVDSAVKSSRAAFESWSKLSCHERAKHIYSIARHIQKHQRLISVVESLDNGKSIRESRDLDIPIVVRHLYHHAGWAELMNQEMRNWKSVGVVGAIVPWNFPLMLLSWKVCPALAMGNTVVLKPATYTRLTALLFAEICAEAGLPPGVFNVVTGGGAMGSQLATHPDVDKVAFTGSTDVGKILRRATAGTGKKLSLELGGKSAVIVFDSADLDSAVEGVVNAIYFNQGQVCSAGSKLLIQESVYDKFIAKVKERMTHLRLGSSLDKAIDMGPVVDQSQKASVEEYVKSAQEEGAEIHQLCSGVPSQGLFFPPTLITNVQTTSRVVVEEIFGPVLVALPFRTAKEAVALANNSIYGLGGSVWSEDLALAVEVARNVKTGTMWINSHNVFDAAAGFGGYKQSGFGRDGGKEGLFEYVKPSWSSVTQNHELNVAEIVKSFGSSIADRPNFNKPKSPLSTVDHTYKLYYGGAQKRPDGNYSKVIVSHENVPVTEVPESNRKDIRNAVEAAQKAQPGWEKRTGHNKAQILYYIAENLEVRKDEFSDKLCKLAGLSKEAADLEVDTSVQRLFYWASYADKFGGNVQETQMYGTVIKLHEPVGVIGIACPDQYPLLGFISLFAPAIARGNAVVIIPSEKFPMFALDMYQIFDTSDVPGGVLNILTGTRAHIAKYLTEHQDVQSMWYHGPDVEGSAFVEYASADSVKRTWVSYGKVREWINCEQGQGEEFLYHSIQCKNIWLPMGEIFAN